MLSAGCREPRPSQFSPRLQVRVISTSNIYFIFYYFIYDTGDHLLGDYFKKDNGLIVFF